MHNRSILKAVKVTLVDSISSAEAVLPELLSSRYIGFDCEGSNLSRWGKLSVMQFKTLENAIVCDTQVPGVIDVLRPVLESETVTKVTHDCREDAAALYHQTGTKLKGVIDLQIAGWLIRGQKNGEVKMSLIDCPITETPMHLPSLSILKQTLGMQNSKLTALKSSVANLMEKEPDLWAHRPLPVQLVKYAVADVLELLEMRDQLEQMHTHADWLECEKGRMIQNYLAYPYINQHIRWPGSVLKRGMKLKGMITASTGSSLIMKLNCGKVGVVNGPGNLSNSRSHSIGDYVDCFVSSWDAVEKTVFLERVSW